MKHIWVLLLLAGCTTIPKVPGSTELLTTALDQESSSCNPMLGLLGGLCCLGGMIMLVITQGKVGWRPIIGGIVFIMINYALAMYAHWFFIPVAISTGVIGLAYTSRIVIKILKNKELKELKLWNS
mgnify:FL=1|tara:strand:- start:915 stop:1292 length:378 start_codon:yes stop_codon:yes gene_type:complete